MKKPFLIALALTVAPFAAQAETWNIYGWQNHSWEFVDEDNGRSYNRIQSNAGNIGFAASVPTGMNDISVNVRCEQFTYFNHFAGGTGWCNRNSKIGLSHPMMGEIMFATWLLPYNEGVAQWVDPFYDAGADSHTSIMGSVGAHTIFYNTGDFDFQASASGPGTGFSGAEFNYAGGGYDTGFNRRQENIIQYWSPNWNGFVFRFAWTAGNRDETVLHGNEVDPVIRSSSLAYTNGPLWLAVTWQDHEDWTAVSVGEMQSSDAESMRVAGRYIMDMGDGMSVQLSAMWETLEYEFNGVTSVDKAMAAFGYGNFASSYTLQDSNGDPLMATEAMEAKPATYTTFAMLSDEDEDAAIKAQKTLQLIYETFDDTTQTGLQIDSDVAGVTFPTLTLPADDNRLTAADESKTTGCAAASPSTCTDTTVSLADFDADYNATLTADAEGYDATKAAAAALQTAINALNTARDLVADDAADEDTQGVQAPDLTADVNTTAGGTVAQRNAQVQYDLLVAAATEEAMEAFEPEELTAAVEAADAMPRDASTAGQNIKVERDAWMVSGKIKMGGPIDFRFSYMDADDLEVSCGSCSGDWDETAADAWNVGVFYTMPAGTELRLTYSEVDNDTNASYDFGIGTLDMEAGQSAEMFAVGIVHWFD